MYNITEEQIKDIAQGGGKSKIKQMFPQVFETKLEVGEWYKFYWKGEPEIKAIIHLSKIEGKEVHFDYGLSIMDGGEWVENDWYNKDHDYRPATAKEVEEALIQEAKKRGFVEGAKYKNWYASSGTIKESFYKYDPIDNILGQVDNLFKGNHHFIFDNNKWAEIIPEPKVITKTEAENRLQDLTGETFKVRDEQPDRCEYNLPNWCGK